MSFEPPKPLSPPPREVAGACVLVVDDEQVWRLILETDLRMLGYRVAVARDAQEALALARRERPRVAIVDLMLPEPLDGWALVEELRAQGTPTPVILYSAYPVAGQRQDPDVVGCMSKVTDRAELYALLPSAIRRLAS
ncbi:MAG TPA: response regulator [Candidatus Dormibacteraeota bacterium]|nr:response regulator [Candidatus Dormibacteraeota bacterium]